MVITVEQALELIYNNISSKSIKILPIEEVLGFVLAEDVIASHNLPPFDNSAMDGYAVKLEDAGKSVRVEHTIFAGDDSKEELSHGVAIKIMTGAKIPLGTQCIVPIEDVTESKDGVKLPSDLTLSKHIRLCGEDIKKETHLLHIGTRLTAHQITLLASQGVSHVKVHKKPRVALFASGNELKMHFEEVQAHQLYNTNTPTLLSRAQELGCEVEFIGTAKDTMQDINLHIQSALENNDLIITSGGVSVGDADFTKEAFSTFGYDIFFDKIAIKPGKPTTFGRIGKTLVLNLPGNPLAAALNFELFGQSIILALGGSRSRYLNTIKAKMKNKYTLRAGRRTLVPGYFDGEYFEESQNFAPGMVSPLSEANSYIMIDESCSVLEEEAQVNIIPITFSFTSKTQKSLVSL